MRGFPHCSALCNARHCIVVLATWWTDNTLHWHNMGWLSVSANAETSYIWSGLDDAIFHQLLSLILLIVVARISIPSLYDFVKYFRPIFETSQKLRIPQGWACSGGIGPNLFEEEIGKCENHKFQTNFRRLLKFVTFNMC